MIPSLSGRPDNLPDALMLALAEVCGIEIRELPETQARYLNRILAQLRRVGATGDEVRGRARDYERKCGGHWLTPASLARHWAALRAVPKSRISWCQECGFGGGAHHTDCVHFPETPVTLAGWLQTHSPSTCS